MSRRSGTVSIFFSSNDLPSRKNRLLFEKKVIEFESKLESFEIEITSTLEGITDILIEAEGRELSLEETLSFKKIENDITKIKSDIENLSNVINTSPEKVISNALLQDRITDVEQSMFNSAVRQEKEIDRVYSVIGWSMGGLFIALLIQLIGPFFTKKAPPKLSNSNEEQS